MSRPASRPRTLSEGENSEVSRRILLFGALVFLLSLGGGLLLWRHISGDRPGSIPSQATPFEVARASLADSSWIMRTRTAAALPSREDISVPQRVELLLGALRREVTKPTVAPILPGSWPPFTNFVRLHYLAALEQIGKPAAGPIRALTQQWRGEEREWGLLALGGTGEAAAAPELRRLLINSHDADVRMTAARYLGALGDRHAVPTLTQALRDTAIARPLSDMPGHRMMQFYPVRVHAAAALEAMGVPVIRSGHNVQVR